MKFSALLLCSLLFSADAFSGPLLTFAVKSKAPVKKAAPKAVKAAPAPKSVKAKPAPAPKAVKAKPAPAPKAVKTKPAPAPKAVKAKPTPAPKAVKAKPAPKAVVAPVMRSSSSSPVPIPSVSKPRVAPGSPSKALPYSSAGTPSGLDGQMVGDMGFDPVGFATTEFGPFWNSGPDTLRNLDWYREAELQHGRIAQVAVVGFLWPELVGTFPGNDFTGPDFYSNTHPLEAWANFDGFAKGQILAAITFLEWKRLLKIEEQGASYQPGDSGLGQTGWNPFKFNYSPEEYEEKRLQELKHCRLAMLGAFGLICQANASGVGVIEQISGGFSWPEYVAKAGYYFPEGI